MRTDRQDKDSQDLATGRTAPQRYGVLDAYRYIAAICVAFYHFENDFQPYMAQHTDFLERFHLFVDFFFVLSGFVLMHTYGARISSLADYGRFLRKRLARIYPLHAATTLLFVAIAWTVLRLGLPVRDPSAFDIAPAPYHLLLIHAWGLNVKPALNFPSWSISAELFVYLLFPFLAWAVARTGAWRGLALAYACGLALTLTHEALGLRPWTQTTFDFGNLRAVPGFLAGMALQRLVVSANVPRVPFWAAHGAALALGALMLAKLDELAIVALLPLVIGLIALAERSGAPSALGRGVWLKLGEASYGVYMLHTFVALCCLAMMRHFGLTTPLGMVFIALVGVVGSTVAALISFRHFENPLRIYLGGGSPKSAAVELRKAGALA